MSLIFNLEYKIRFVSSKFFVYLFCTGLHESVKLKTTVVNKNQGGDEDGSAGKESYNQARPPGFNP